VVSGPVLNLPPPPGSHRRSIFDALVTRALLFTLLALALLFGMTVWESWQSVERSLAATVDTDIAGLADIHASAGEAELLARLDDRSSVVSLEGRQARYLAARADGSFLAGNIKEWPGLAPSLSEQGYVTLSDGTRVYARATRLAPDLDLLVARTYARDWNALVRLMAMFALGAAVIVLASWSLGRRAAGTLRRRIGQISKAFRSAEDGGEIVLPDSAFDDEIGELAELSARSIARSANLAHTHRHMSDHIAHEIRTPLTHLDSRLVNAMRTLPPECDPEVLERCRRDIRGVVTMLDSLLDIASSEARVGDITGLSEVDLSDLATNLVDLYAGSAEEAGIALRHYIEPGVRLLGEPMQLTRLLSNLLDNALKYVPRGGQVTLSICQGPVIEVRDDGPGIEPALRPLVFERFRTGQSMQPADRFGGGKTSHGLGLALVRAIALRHGMGIALANRARGAHFIIKPHAMWAKDA
jgi:signal transduction histidine kinase